MATLSAVALIANLIIKREKVFCLNDAMRFAMNTDTFKRTIFAIFQK